MQQWQLVSWSSTSLFSTNMAISETKQWQNYWTLSTWANVSAKLKLGTCLMTPWAPRHPVWLGRHVFLRQLGRVEHWVNGVDSVKERVPECVGESQPMCRLVVQQLGDEVKQKNMLLVWLRLHIPLNQQTYIGLMAILHCSVTTDWVKSFMFPLETK